MKRFVATVAAAASLLSAKASVAGEFYKQWFTDNVPNSFYFEAYDAKVVSVSYYRDSTAVDITGSDFSAGSLRCEFPGPDRCSGGVSYSNAPLGRMKVSGGRVYIEFFGWPPTPDDFTFEGLPLLYPGVSDYYSYLSIVIDGPGREATYYENQAAYIPEPATWALMIMGFAGVSVAMRRRTRELGRRQAAR